MEPCVRFLHSVDPKKLEAFGRKTTEELLDSLLPGQREALRARPDGTVLNGHHRLTVLKERGVDIDALPREVIPKQPLDPNLPDLP